MFYLSIFFGKLFTLTSRFLNLGDGSTWPGHIALRLNPNFLKDIYKKVNLKVVFIVGTNGKTTTSSMIATVLKENNKTLFQNTSGANLKNGIVSAFITNANFLGKINAEYAVIEVDENNLPLLLADITPRAIVVTNLFRDQLDRYGELDTIAKKWALSFKNLTSETNLILNADDPLVASLAKGTQASVHFFGLEDKTENKVHQHASDSIYCPLCKTKLSYSEIYYSHLGHWECLHCKFARPKVELSEISCSLPGTYNKYNALAAGLFLLGEKIPMAKIEEGMKNITAVFGRQEKIVHEGKNIQIFLSKNPTGFNQSLATIFSNSENKNLNFLIALNDNIPDGRDVSWIWDIDFEPYLNNIKSICVSGTRVYDMALRLQYAEDAYGVLSSKYQIEGDLKNAISLALERVNVGETLFVLPTYSAMLDIRKILTGRKIL